MEYFVVFVIFCVTSPVLTSVVTENGSLCALNEYRCDDGSCVSFNRICDGTTDCPDGTDESSCFLGNSRDELFGEETLSRSRRQTTCRKNQWKCRDGSCIGFDGKCDGIVDCPDGSDETHPLCRKNRCQTNWFRCTYGACVDGTAACNNIQECADNSDELQPQCFKEIQEVKGQFKCENGGTISAADKCDGKPDCKDGSDETLRACAANQCASYLFQCAYGACVDQGSDCNGISECADGSDESDELCNRMGTTVPTKPTVKPPTNTCVLPPYPEHGEYQVTGFAKAKPGQTFGSVFLTVTCNLGYGVIGNSTLYCFAGAWLDKMPVCSKMCKLNGHPSVEYRCQIPQSEGGSRECNPYEPINTVVIPTCQSPNYYSPTGLPHMRCTEAGWDNLVTCSPECGKITPAGKELVIGGRYAERGELPWHVGIFNKAFVPYMQICGGSIVSTSIVISAAHCFWNDVEKQMPASKYAVAAGKLYRPWNNPMDTDVQKSNVSEIHIPVRFRGRETNFQEDIAIMILATHIEYKTYIRPVCIDFDINFNNLQLSPGRVGKVAGWGYDGENGKASQILKVTDFPYVDINECLSNAPPGFREYITADKICAGYSNGTAALCQGDSGGGLVFPELDRGTERYYLRGIVSTAPKDDNLCNRYVLTSFTTIISHEHFIKTFYRTDY